MATGNDDINRWQKNDYIRLAASFIPAAILTWGIHEYAHWLMGRSLGYDMWITFNQVGLVQGSYDSALHQGLVAMAGPFVTWLQAVAALFLIRQRRQLWSYSFLFLPFWMRTVAMIISFLSNPNDEARVSLLLNMPMWVVPAISVIFLFVLTYLGSRSLRAGWKSNGIGYIMASIVTAIVLYSDQLISIPN